MGGKREKPEDIVLKLRQVEVLLFVVRIFGTISYLNATNI